MPGAHTAHGCTSGPSRRARHHVWRLPDAPPSGADTQPLSPASSRAASPPLVTLVKLPFHLCVNSCAHDHRPLINSQTKTIPGVTRTSPLGPISPPWAPPRADSPAGSQSGKRTRRELGLGDRLPTGQTGRPRPMPLTGLLGRPRWARLWALRVLKAGGGRPALQSRSGGGDGPQQEPRLLERVGLPLPEASQSRRPVAASPLEPCSPGSLPWGSAMWTPSMVSSPFATR